MSLISQIALTGLQASQIALAATAQNTANRNTAGYSRLDPVLQSRVGQGTSPGAGVDVAAIRRIADAFQNRQLWRAGAEQQLQAGARPYFQAVESLLAGEGSNISKGLDQFFAAVSEASATPSSQALRQQLLTEAGNLAQRFNSLSKGLQAQLDGLAAQREAVVVDINALTANLALMNRRITEAKAVGGDIATLQDHRDEMVRALGQHVRLQVRESAEGAYDIALDSGQPLVIGGTPAGWRWCATVMAASASNCSSPPPVPASLPMAWAAPWGRCRPAKRSCCGLSRRYCGKWPEPSPAASTTCSPPAMTATATRASPCSATSRAASASCWC